MSIFYISSSLGNDSNSGTSPAAPWETLDKLHTSWGLVSPGDSVLLLRGDTWAPTTIGVRSGIIQIPANKNGTASQPITIGAYGDPADEKPYIDGQYVTTYHGVFRFSSASYWVVQDIKMYDTYGVCGVDLRPMQPSGLSSAGIHHVKFLRLDISSDGWGGSGGIRAYKEYTSQAAPTPNQNAPFHHIEIGWCTFDSMGNDRGSDCINLIGLADVDTADFPNAWVHNNTFTKIQEEAIDLNGGNNHLIEYNYISGTSVNGIKIASQFSNFHDSIIRGNAVIQAGLGTNWTETPIGLNGNAIVAQNITNCKIYNNLFSSRWVASIGDRDRTGTEAHYGNFDGNEITNNIFHGAMQIAGDENGGQDATIGFDNTFSYNLYFANYETTVIRYWVEGSVDASQTVTAANFTTEWVNKWSTVGDTYEDPDFVDPTWTDFYDAGDWSLAATSPAIDSGTNITGYDEDINGDTVPQGLTTDKGPYEYPTGDLLPPQVVSAVITNKNTVEVNFNEAVDETTAETSTNYGISGSVTVSAAVKITATKVILTTSDHSEGNYTVTVTNVEDLYSNVISGNNTANYTYTAPYSGDNVMVNGDFETGDKTGWSDGNSYGGAVYTFTVGTSNVISGTYSGIVSITTAGTSVGRPMLSGRLSETMDITKDYIFKFKTTVISGSPIIYSMNYGEGVTPLGSSGILSGSQVHTFNVTPTETLEYVYFYLDGREICSFAIDDVEFYEEVEYSGPTIITQPQDTQVTEGSGTTAWADGDAVVNTGGSSTGEGFIDIYSEQGIDSGTGPTIVGNIRDSNAAWSDFSSNWALGNLNGLYGVSTTLQGLAVGKYSGVGDTYSLFLEDEIKMYANDTQRVSINSNGSGWLVADNLIYWDSSGTLNVDRITAKDGTIGGFTINVTEIKNDTLTIGSSSSPYSLPYIQIGTAIADADPNNWLGEGIFLGQYDEGTSKYSFFVGNAASDNMYYTSADGLNIKGNITAETGYIGTATNGFTITSDTISRGVAKADDSIALGGNFGFGANSGPFIRIGSADYPDPYNYGVYSGTGLLTANYTSNFFTFFVGSATGSYISFDSYTNDGLVIKGNIQALSGDFLGSVDVGTGITLDGAGASGSGTIEVGTGGMTLDGTGTGTITGGTMQTSSGTAQRIVIDGTTNRLNYYDGSNNNVVRIGEDIYSTIDGIDVSGGIIYSHGSGANAISILGTVTNGSGVGVAIQGTSSGTSSSGYAVKGVATSTTGANYGIYGEASGGSTNWAGYFQGNVYVAWQLTVGSKGSTSNKISAVHAGDGSKAGFEAMGNSSGTGYLYVGQSSTYGGGMIYQGDTTPAVISGSSVGWTTFFRRNNSTDTAVFAFPYNDTKVSFYGDIQVDNDIINDRVFYPDIALTGSLSSRVITITVKRMDDTSVGLTERLLLRFWFADASYDGPEVITDANNSYNASISLNQGTMISPTTLSNTASMKEVMTDSSDQVQFTVTPHSYVNIGSGTKYLMIEIQGIVYAYTFTIYNNVL